MAQRLKEILLSWRTLSWVVLIPVSLFILYKGPPYSVVLGTLVALGILIEWMGLVKKYPGSKIFFGLIGTAYLTIAVASGLFMLAFNYRTAIGLLLIVWATDTAAFLGGSFLKGPKLAPSISPHKTWSGFLTGMVVGVGVGGVLSWYFLNWFIVARPLQSGILLSLLVLTAQLGDLLESKVKRMCDVKDSGNLIPGHGGLLDRLDSFLAVAFFMAVFVLLLALTDA